MKVLPPDDVTEEQTKPRRLQRIIPIYQRLKTLPKFI